MRLASPEQLLSLIGMNPTSPGSLKAAEDALDASFATVEQAAECRLSICSLTDTFILTGTKNPSLRLTSGFLASESITIVSGSATIKHVLRKEGVLLLSGSPVGEIDFKYSCGFVAGPDGKTLQSVPDVLASAHLHLAASLMQLSPTAVPKAKAQAMATDAAKGFEGKAYRILQGIARPRAMVDWPIRSKG